MLIMSNETGLAPMELDGRARLSSRLKPVVGNPVSEHNCLWKLTSSLGRPQLYLRRITSSDARRSRGFTHNRCRVIPQIRYLIHDSHTYSIIAVHGLGSNWAKSWIWRAKSHVPVDEGKNWLCDLLPVTLKQMNPAATVRVFCFNYNSQWLGQKTYKTRLQNIATNLLKAVDEDRRSVSWIYDYVLLY